ncbi:MAG: hypothetical protein WDA24_08300 [Tissierellales bacterium]
MKKILLGNMELLVDKFNRDYIKSEISGKNLIRIKCETVVKDGDHDKLKKLLENEKFELSLADDKLSLSARKGEISYNYTDGNPFKDKSIDYIHVLEIIEYEEIKDIESVNKVSLDTELTLVKKRISMIEKILLNKGLISKDDLDDILKN